MNRHPNASFLVLGGGPSLNEYHDEIFQFIDRYQPIVMGTNNITGFVLPDYHAFTNRKRFIEYAHTIDPAKSKVLLGAYFPEWLISRHWQGPYEPIMYVDDHDATFNIRSGVIQASCRTVVNLLLGVAIVMGARGPLYAAGIDGWTPQIQRGDDLSFYSETWLAHENEPFFAELERLSTRFLTQINDYLIARKIGRLQILTPTVYEEFYQPIGGLI